MTAEQRELYGKAFDTFATTMNKMQSGGLDSVSAANRVIELSEQVPAPSRGAWAQTRKRFFGSSVRSPMPNRMRYASTWLA